ncbi:methyl-accepting chemotaxis protein [Anaerotignum sp.]|uniref:methyl-accepting chemotaxis protein n=1 Tax=Anaerotignum sp. TaxID=2039241 RepID=UPI0028B00C4C|nr:methyl-accepting chemotaxis protein [Anaerotignum sp.]
MTNKKQMKAKLARTISQVKLKFKPIFHFKKPNLHFKCLYKFKPHFTSNVVFKKKSVVKEKLGNKNFPKTKSKLRITDKLLLVCGIAIGMNVLMIVIVLGALQGAENKMQSFYDVEYKNSMQQMQIRNDVESLDHAILSAVYNHNYQNSNLIVEQAVQKTVADINTLKKQFFDDELMKQVNNTLNEFLAQEMKVMSYVFAGQTERALALIDGDYTHCVESLYTVLDTVSAKAEEAATNALQQTTQQRHKMTIVLIFVIFLLGMILLFASTMLARTIRKATQKVLHIADRIENGNLTVSEKRHRGGDELDDVIYACEEMALTLQVLIQDVGCMLDEMARGNMVFETQYRQYYVGDYNSLLVAAENMQRYINFALNNVDAATIKVEDHVKQVSQGAQHLSNHAVRQDESITQLSNSLSIISQNAQHNTTQIQEINNATLDMKEQVEITKKKMSETSAAILDVSNHTDKIKKIIRTIDEIAFQTDLLALNASIEAARAGSAGRGFAVVAGEVRALAQKVAQAAKETTVLIDNSMQATDKCVGTVSYTAQSLDLVVQRTNDITGMITEIATIVKEEQEDIQSISYEAENIREIVKLNTKTAQQFAFGSESGYQQVNILKKQMEQFIRQEEIPFEEA